MQNFSVAFFSLEKGKKKKKPSWTLLLRRYKPPSCVLEEHTSPLWPDKWGMLMKTLSDVCHVCDPANTSRWCFRCIGYDTLVKQINHVVGGGFCLRSAKHQKLPKTLRTLIQHLKDWQQLAEMLHILFGVKATDWSMSILFKSTLPMSLLLKYTLI